MALRVIARNFEDGGKIFLRNDNIQSKHYATQQPRRSLDCIKITCCFYVSGNGFIVSVNCISFRKFDGRFINR